jgi:Uma2 family endonuclease
MQVTLPEQALPAKLTLNPKLRIKDDDEYWAFCAANPDVRFERTAQGEIVIVPPVGGEGDFRNMEVSSPLGVWSKKDGRGRAFGPSVEFILPSGAALSPDASWVSNGRLAKLTKEQRRKFLRLCPQFIVEVMSPSDRLKDAKEKMAEWMANGVQLGWLIDGDRQTVYIYRAGRSEPEKRTGIKRLAGEGPIAGFVLDLADIWAGL